MIYEVKDFKLELIEEPMQSHVVAWEGAARALKNEDAKPLLNHILAELQKISVTDHNAGALIGVYHLITEALEQAIRVLDENESLTLSANRGVMVKAAIMAGWIVSLKKLPEKPRGKPQRIMQTVDEVDAMKPWLVQWIAERVAALYVEATTIPKN
jgi:hypothetical protein